MSTTEGKWGDLLPRVLSAIAMLILGLLAVWAGGLWIHLLVSAACGLMVWELASMLRGEAQINPLLLALLAGCSLLVASYTPFTSVILPLLLAPAFVGWSQLKAGRVIFLAYVSMILIAGFSLITLRDDFGIVWMGWLILVVIVTDIAGYFAGRILGGPKFWPAVSPKKTWSGTVAGWIGAAIVGALFAMYVGGGVAVIIMSVLTSFASQLGDIAESAIKRHVGIKDSSHLIPGHGGLLDRFDGMLGAAMLLIVLTFFISFPPVMS